MSMYFQKAGLNDFTYWIKKQAAEELECAYRLIDYALDRGGDITIGQIDAVPTGWGDPLEVFKHVYRHECCVSKLIDKLIDIAGANRDHTSRDFLFWSVRRQVEEESTTKRIVDQLKDYGECHCAIVNHRLGKR